MTKKEKEQEAAANAAYYDGPNADVLDRQLTAAIEGNEKGSKELLIVTNGTK